jgi:hypothetical protein
LRDELLGYHFNRLSFLVEGLVMLEDVQYHRQAHGDDCAVEDDGHHDHGVGEGVDVACRLSREGHKAEVGGVEQDLDADEDTDHVPLHHEAPEADDEHEGHGDQKRHQL